MKRDDLDKLLKWYDDADESSLDARENSERDRDYYDGYQWTDDEIETMTKRGQPPIVVNRIRRKINYVLGYEQRLRTDPKAMPRTPKHEEAAKAATDALRYIVETNRFDRLKSSVFANMVVEGFGGCEISLKQGRDGIDIILKHVHWDRLFYDPHSRERDFSDARYVGTVTWIDEALLRAQFPDKKSVIDSTGLGNKSLGETYDDKPRRWWTTERRDRMKVIAIFYRDPGKGWMHAIFTDGGFLKDPDLIPYQDEDGANWCPLIMQSAYVDRDNMRYGEVRELIGLQDEINKRRSKALHLMTMRQVVLEEGAVRDVNAARKQLSRADGVIEVAPGLRFEILPTGDMAQGQFELLAEAKNEIDLSGANAALMGKDQLGLSGKAIQAQQQGGATELQPLMDALRDWHLTVLRRCWQLVRQYWTEERWVRVTDDENNLRFVGLNRPVTAGEMLQQRFAELPPEEQQARAQELQMAMQDPRAQEVVDTANDVAELDVDIYIEEQPDIISLQSEQFEQLAQMAGAGVPIPPDVLIEASSLRNKKQLLDMMRQGQGAPDPRAEAEARKLESETIKNESQAQLNLAKAGQTQVGSRLDVAQAMMPQQTLPQGVTAAG
jgi:hypothetical protein